MMTCKEVLESLSSFIDEDLKQEVAQQMHKHIHVCSECRAHFDTMTMTIKLYRHVESPSMPAECHDRLVKVLELERMKAVKAAAPAPQGGPGSGAEGGGSTPIKT